MNFISKHITREISNFSRSKLKETGGYLIIIENPVIVGSGWMVSGFNIFGNPSTENDISISFSLFKDRELLNVWKQIKENKFKILKK